MPWWGWLLALWIVGWLLFALRSTLGILMVNIVGSFSSEAKAEREGAKDLRAEEAFIRRLRMMPPGLRGITLEHFASTCRRDMPEQYAFLLPGRDDEEGAS